MKTMANASNSNGQLTANCTSPPCTPSPCNSPISVTNLSDQSNHSIRSSPTNLKTNQLINTTTASIPINTHSAVAANLLNQVVLNQALSSPLSTSPTASSLSSSPSSSLASPITLDHNVTSNEKFSTADLLLQQKTQQLNNSIKTLTQAKVRTNGNNTTKENEKNGKVSNFSIEAIMASRDVESQNIKSGIFYFLNFFCLLLTFSIVLFFLTYNLHFFLFFLNIQKFPSFYYPLKLKTTNSKRTGSISKTFITKNC